MPDGYNEREILENILHPQVFARYQGEAIIFYFIEWSQGRSISPILKAIADALRNGNLNKEIKLDLFIIHTSFYEPRLDDYGLASAYFFPPEEEARQVFYLKHLQDISQNIVCIPSRYTTPADLVKMCKDNDATPRTLVLLSDIYDPMFFLSNRTGHLIEDNFFESEDHTIYVNWIAYQLWKLFNYNKDNEPTGSVYLEDGPVGITLPSSWIRERLYFQEWPDFTGDPGMFPIDYWQDEEGVCFFGVFLWWLINHRGLPVTLIDFYVGDSGRYYISQGISMMDDMGNDLYQLLRTAGAVFLTTQVDLQLLVDNAPWPWNGGSIQEIYSYLNEDPSSTGLDQLIRVAYPFA